MITDQLRSRIYGGTQKALWEQLWNLPESAKSVLQMVTFRLYMISRESQLSHAIAHQRGRGDTVGALIKRSLASKNGGALGRGARRNAAAMQDTIDHFFDRQRLLVGTGQDLAHPLEGMPKDVINDLRSIRNQLIALLKDAAP